MNPPALPSVSVRRRSRGLSLVELMVALALGSLLIGGALYMYQQGRGTFVVNERAARIQDAARYVIAYIEPDVEMAGYYGATNLADTVRFVSGGDPNNVLAYAKDLRQVRVRPSDPAPVALGQVSHVCGLNFAVDVSRPVQGTNNGYVLGAGADATACAPVGGALAGADTLTVRRVATQRATPPWGGRVQVLASRLTSRTSHLMFTDASPPGNLANPNVGVHNFVVRTYYVSRDSVGRPGFPSLRVKFLGPGTTFADEEVMSGIEDFQVQFGIDDGDLDQDNIVDPNEDLNDDGIFDTNERIVKYVDPDHVDVMDQVVAVRFWVRVRADQPEVGFVDNRTYTYADRQYTPQGNEQRFRRVLMSRTVMLRNARTL
jgi:type IV pilus assembly protein PilW